MASKLNPQVVETLKGTPIGTKLHDAFGDLEAVKTAVAGGASQDEIQTKINGLDTKLQAFAVHVAKFQI